LEKRIALLDDGLDVAVLQNEPPTFLCSPHHHIHHGAGQVVGANYLMREYQSKCGVDRAQQALAEIRLPPRRHWVDVRGSENVNAGKARRE